MAPASKVVQGSCSQKVHVSLPRTQGHTGPGDCFVNHFTVTPLFLCIMCGAQFVALPGIWVSCKEKPGLSF